MFTEYGISEVNLEGFQLVHGQYFNRGSEPVLSIFYSGISFNSACHSMLNDCGAIHFLINEKARRILVKPAPSKDRDAVEWTKVPDSHKNRKMECSRVAHQIFEKWGWEKELHYRSVGRLVSAEGKVMLLFDFNEPERWRGSKLVDGFA